MSKDTDKIISPDGAKDAFNSLISEYHKISPVSISLHSGSYSDMIHKLKSLPKPDKMQPAFMDWVHSANCNLGAMENAKTKPQFKEARNELVADIRGILNIYIITQKE